MNLTRIGSNRREKTGIAFEGKNPEISFNESDSSITLDVDRGDGMGTSGEYDYSIKLSADDLHSLLVHLSNQGAAYKKGKLQDTLIKSSNSILRLLIASSAVPFEVALTSRELRLKEIKEKLKTTNKEP